MSKKRVERYECGCEKCGHEWVTRNSEVPKICPKCKSHLWDEGSAGKSDEKPPETPKKTGTMADKHPILRYEEPERTIEPFEEA